MRKLVLVVAVIIAVAIGVSLSTLRTRVDRGARSFAEELAKATKADVTIGGISFAAFPPAVTVVDVAVSTLIMDGEEAKYVELPSVRVVPRILPLLMGKAKIDAIDIYQPVFRIRRLPNLMPSFLSEKIIRAVADSPVGVRIHGATVEITDEANDPGGRFVATGVDAEIGTDGETISVEATGSPFGESSHGNLIARLAPGAGPTGGDALMLDASIAGADGDAIKALFPILADVDLGDSIELTLKGDGFLGERGTESVPAKSWEGTMTAAGDLAVAGSFRPTRFDVTVSADDKRYQVRSGRGVWGDLNFDVSGWYSNTGNGKLAGRLVFDEFSAEQLAASFDVAEAWRPVADVSLSIRMMGILREPLFRYEARAEEFTLAGFPGHSISVSPLQARGSVLAINAEVSSSLDCENLKVGNLGWDQALVGLQYWRKKLRINAGDAEIWGGVLGGGFMYFPYENGRAETGGVFSAGDAAELLAAVVPESTIPVAGSTDWLARATRDSHDDEWVGNGRIAVHDGTFGDRNYLLDVLRDTFDGTPGFVDSLAEAHSAVLGADEVRFRRASFDVETVEGGYAFHAGDIDMYRARLVMEATTAGSKDGLSGRGTIELSKAMTEPFVGKVRGIESLIADDGKLRIPVELAALANRISLQADPEFKAALASAAAGRPATPFAMIETDDVPESLAMPDMLQQFGR